MLQVCPAGPTVPGIDIYHGDYINNINLVMGSGVKYAYLKAWEYSEDASFAARWIELDGKVIRGAYDFFHASKDPIAQAKAFLNTFGGVLKPTDLPCALDFEVSDGEGRIELLNAALAWLEYVEQATKKTPVLYMSPGFIILDSRFDRFPLWVANYGVKCPHVPTDHQTWEFWQGSGSGIVPGMKGVCDTDIFNGDLTALQAFCAKTI